MSQSHRVGAAAFGVKDSRDFRPLLKSVGWETTLAGLQSLGSRLGRLSTPLTVCLLCVVFAAALGAYLLGAGTTALRVPGVVAGAVILASVWEMAHPAVARVPAHRDRAVSGRVEAC